MQRHRFEQASRAIRLLPVLLFLGGTGGCGARTGLPVPELEPEPSEAEVPCIELPVGGRSALVDLATDAELARADIFLLMDNTGSMDDEIAEITRSLRDRIAPLVFATIPDTEFGVGTFSDFPVSDAFVNYGAPGDRPFELRRRMTDNLSAVQGALERIGLRAGGDDPESQLEALYQTATGEGVGEFVEPSLGCPGGGFGAPCFRDDAQPVVLLFTDAPFHNGPSDPDLDYEFGLIDPEPHSYRETVEVLTDNHIRVIGMWSGDRAWRRDLSTVVGDTGTLDRSGEPLVFDIGKRGQDLGTGVVDSLVELAAASVFDVRADAVDPEPFDGVDVTDFVKQIVPVRAQPMSNVSGIDEDTSSFLGVIAGTTVVFQVTLKAEGAVRLDRPQRFDLIVRFIGDGRTFLGEQPIELVIPSLDGEGCGASVGFAEQ